jgi:Glycosyltransferase
MDPATISLFMNVDHDNPCSGLSRFVDELSRRLCRDYRVRVLSTRSTRGIQKTEVNDRLEIIQFPMYPEIITDVHVPKFGAEARRYIQDSDVVFIQSLDCLYPAYYAAKLRKPIVFYLHELSWERAVRFKWVGKIADPAIRRVFRWLCQKSSSICIPSSSFEPVLRRQGIDRPVTVVPCGIDSEKFRPPEQAIQAKLRLNWDPGLVYLGYVGRFWGEKNLPFLVKVFSALYERYPQIRLALVGGGIPKYEKDIPDHPGILKLGLQREVAPYYQAMDIFCMPSLTETSSCATMEAMACGVPPVANAVGCLKEYIRHGANGFLADLSSDPAAFHQGLEALIQNPELRERMGRAARREIQENFSWECTVQSLSALFEKISNHTPALLGTSPGVAQLAESTRSSI